MTQCPGGLTVMGTDSLPMQTFTITQDDTVLNCKQIYGLVDVKARNVTISNSTVAYDTGLKGTAANGTAPIKIEDGASATVDHVEIDGRIGTHACIWNQGTPNSAQGSLTARFVNCYNVDDGIFSWADTSYSQTTGDGFTIEYSYFHDFTTQTSNGHIDGFQTEGANDGTIHHNTYLMESFADSCIAIWDSLKSSSNITVEDNLMTGGGFSIYAEDYNPSEASPVGGFTVTATKFLNNKFSTKASGCVGNFGVWFYRPQYAYLGGPTDGWNRSGNYVIETGETVDTGNPHDNGVQCN
jgi:hypothetical protein